MDEKPNYESGKGNCFDISKPFETYKKPANQETKSIIESMGEAFVRGEIPNMDSAKKMMDDYVKSRKPENKEE
jgi:hypothetical protein